MHVTVTPVNDAPVFFPGAPITPVNPPPVFFPNESAPITPVNHPPVFFQNGFFDETDYSGGAGGTDTATVTAPITPVNDWPMV